MSESWAKCVRHDKDNRGLAATIADSVINPSKNILAPRIAAGWCCVAEAEPS